jgi:glycosyltransferase involved in cell wall biosynthesis
VVLDQSNLTLQNVELSAAFSYPVNILCASCGSQHQQSTAKELARHAHLYQMWFSDKLREPSLHRYYRRCWPYHLSVKWLYHTATIGQKDNLLPRFLPIWDAWCRRRFDKIKSSDIDIVFSIMGYGTGPFDLADRLGALKVVDASSSHPTSFYGFWQRECDIWNPKCNVTLPRSLFRRCNQELNRADYIVCASNFVRDSMLYNGIPASKLAVVPYGANTALFEPRAYLPEKPVFVSVGTLTVRKGTQYLLEAMRIVRQQHPSAELLLVGPVHDDFKRLMSKWNGEFTHYPFVQHQDLAKLLTNSLAFVFPSCEEGFARVLTEAMSAGLPIIATHESGATTAVTDGIHGTIVAARDPGALAAAMLRYAQQPLIALEMGSRAAAWARLHGSHEAYGNKLAQIFNDFLSKDT